MTVITCPALQDREQKICPCFGKKGRPSRERLQWAQQKHSSVACQCCPSYVIWPWSMPWSNNTQKLSFIIFWIKVKPTERIDIDDNEGTMQMNLMVFFFFFFILLFTRKILYLSAKNTCLQPCCWSQASKSRLFTDPIWIQDGLTLNRHLCLVALAPPHHSCGRADQCLQ